MPTRIHLRQHVNTNSVATCEDVITVVHAMIEDFRETPTLWENATL